MRSSYALDAQLAEARGWQQRQLACTLLSKDTKPDVLAAQIEDAVGRDTHLVSEYRVTSALSVVHA